MIFSKEMQKALEADGEKLRQLTGEDHGPVFLGMDIGSGDMSAEADIEIGPDGKLTITDIRAWQHDLELKANR